MYVRHSQRTRVSELSRTDIIIYYPGFCLVYLRTYERLRDLFATGGFHLLPAYMPPYGREAILPGVAP